MKKILSIVLIILFIISLFSFYGCSCNYYISTNPSTQSETQIETIDHLWNYADYVDDTILGEGKNFFKCTVTLSTGHVTFIINTNKETVGDALVENKLIDGTKGQYGLYVDTVNGIKADYDKDKSYWAFYIDDTLATTAVDKTKIERGKQYSLVYTKE